jgi:thiol-disulfide isomerase/thioredoxin
MNLGSSASSLHGARFNLYEQFESNRKQRTLHAESTCRIGHPYSRRHRFDEYPHGGRAAAFVHPEAFAAAQKTGKPILVDITAPWCSTCRAQQPILRQLMKDPKFSALVIFEVDFDSQKEAVRSFNARSQSTLIVFKGDTEFGRSVGDTSPASIAALIGAAL